MTNIYILFATFLSQSMMALRDILIAQNYGITDHTEAYVLAYIVPFLVIGVIGSAFGSSLVPFISRYKDNLDNLKEITKELNLIILLVAIVVASLLHLLSPLISYSISHNQSTEVQELTHHYLVLFSYVIPISLIAGFYRSLILSFHEQIFISSLSIIVPTVSVLSLIEKQTGSLDLLIYALGFGYFLEICICQIKLKNKGFNLFRFSKFYLKKFNSLFKNMASVSASILIMTAALAIDQIMASAFLNGGAVALSFANKIISFINSIFGGALSVKSLPVFSSNEANNKSDQNNKLYKKIIIYVFLLLTPVVLFLFLYPNLIVSLLYQRGLFHADDTQQVAEILRYYCLQIPFYITNLVGYSILHARQKAKIIFKISTINFSLNIILNYILLNIMDLAGISLSTSIVYMLSSSMTVYHVLKNKK